MNIYFAMNCFWFWFHKSTRRLLHGSPDDVMRKFCLFEYFNLNNGLEFFLIPSKINSPNNFSNEFYRKISRLKNKSIHIGDIREDFLILPETENDLKVLYKCLINMEIERVVIHANHLKKDLHYIRELFKNTLPDICICVENVDYHWDFGYSVEDLLYILEVFPECYFCLDTAHVWDRKELSLMDFFREERFRNKIMEIHFSCSTRFICQNSISSNFRLYLEKYNPLHALFVLTDFNELDYNIKSLISPYPIVIEGIVPVEDKKGSLLKEEIKILSK